MERRRFIGVAGAAALAWPFAVHAQQSKHVWRIGYLGFGSAASWTSEIEALRGGLRDLGYVDGENITFQFRWAERAEQTFDLAAELARAGVDVIFAPASTQVEPARRATKSIPIVFAQHADPVGLGDVDSLSRPGGNITGISMLLTELSVKELEILKEALPAAVRIGVLWNPDRHKGRRGGRQAARNPIGFLAGGVCRRNCRSIRFDVAGVGRRRTCIVVATLQRPGITPGRPSNEIPFARDLRE
jgi:putative tryptophan/tyrosine transport system substrate-binding protein